KQAEKDCGKEKVFSESLNSGFDGSPCYCQEILSPHVRSCVSFHQPEPEPEAVGSKFIQSIDNDEQKGGQDSKDALNFKRHEIILMAICQRWNAFSFFSFRAFWGSIKRQPYVYGWI
ncbi:hypothetical protein CUMW_259090, partial [Citrus unshiu]